MSQQPTGVVMTAESHGLEVKLQHGPSGSHLGTTAPKDNGGTGAAFSPTDLVGAALVSCALTTMALAAKREGWPWGDAGGTVEKRMTPPPRRIGELVVELRMPKGVPKELRGKYEEIAHGCPVARSLNADLKLPMSFVWPD